MKVLLREKKSRKGDKKSSLTIKKNTIIVGINIQNCIIFYLNKKFELEKSQDNPFKLWFIKII